MCVPMQSIQNNKILESNCRITRVYPNVPGGSGSDLWLRHKKKGVWVGGRYVCGCLRGKKGFGEVQGGPVVITSDLSARSRASQKPLQMHPVWKPHVPQREGGGRVCVFVCGGSSLLSSCCRGAFMKAPTLYPSEHFVKDICSICIIITFHFWD